MRKRLPSIKFEFMCARCGKQIIKTDYDAAWYLNKKEKSGKPIYCGYSCLMLDKGYKPTELQQCFYCGKTFKRGGRIDPRKKSSRTFCSKSCAAKYNNAHKTTGTRRSKLEAWIETKLTELYPSLQIDYNKTDAINAELDIYIPSLHLAFELNGIFHYEPIFGQEKLDKMKRNDANKFALCHENNISLCIIDTSKQTYFTEKNSQQYLDIITGIINENLQQSYLVSTEVH